jgi:hypothetical protein
MTREEAIAWMEEVRVGAEALGYYDDQMPHELEFAMEWLSKKSVFPSEIRRAGEKLRTHLRRVVRLHLYGGGSGAGWRIRMAVAAIMCGLDDPPSV